MEMDEGQAWTLTRGAQGGERRIKGEEGEGKDWKEDGAVGDKAQKYKRKDSGCFVFGTSKLFLYPSLSLRMI